MIGGGMVTVTASMADVLAVIDWKTKEVLEAEKRAKDSEAKTKGREARWKTASGPDLSSVVKARLLHRRADGRARFVAAVGGQEVPDAAGVARHPADDRDRQGPRRGRHAQRRREEASEADGTGTGGTVEEDGT